MRGGEARGGDMRSNLGKADGDISVPVCIKTFLTKLSRTCQHSQPLAKH